VCSKLCLKNRHGEDIQQAEASGKWVCPRCRGSCGEGCASCCNCGPCRKALGLAPTHQIINQARAAGFENVHDFLVGPETAFLLGHVCVCCVCLQRMAPAMRRLVWSCYRWANFLLCIA
jgi:hypothetical protein